MTGSADKDQSVGGLNRGVAFWINNYGLAVIISIKINH